MNLDPSLIAEINEVALILEERIAHHEDEIIRTLQSVASGELEMVETLTPGERVLARELFAWVAAVGPQNVWDRIAPLVPQVVAGTASIADLPLPEALTKPFRDQTPSPRATSRTVSRLAVLLIAYIFYDEFHYPQAETGVYDIAGNPWEKLRWAYRHWLNQLEVAEKDSGLEEFFASNPFAQPPVPFPHEEPDSTAGRVSISCAGDLLAIDVLTPENTPHLFDGITDFYSTADIVTANLESTVDPNRPVGRTQATGQPARMNTSVEMFRKFREEAGINYFATATNHAMDWDESGVLATLGVLNASGAYHSGTAASQAEQDDVLVVDKGNVRVAFLSYTFDLNGYPTPPGKSYLVNEVRFNDADPAPDYSLVRRQVAAARAKGADFIIAHCHWGWEFEMYPHVNIVEAAHELVACGVDMILGNHAHVSQPAQTIDHDGRQVPVFYSFGNFVSYHPESRNSQLTYALKFDLVKQPAQLPTPPTTRATNLEVMPLYIANIQREDESWDCRILKFRDVLANPDGYGLTTHAKSQLPHLEDVVWNQVLSPLARLERQ